MNIAFVSADWAIDLDGRPTTPGGSGYVRTHQPAAVLGGRGHRTVVGSMLAVGKDDHLVPLNHDQQPIMLRPDVLIVQRWMHADAADHTRAARAAGQVVIHDVDDWFWGLDPANRAYHSTSKRRSSQTNREHYRDAVAAADLVTCSTPFLARRIRERFGAPTVVLRNAVDTRTFTHRPPSDTDRPIIGWVGALAWRSGDLEMMHGVLGPWLAEHDCRFVHNGTFPTDTDTAADRAGIPHALTLPGLQARPPWDYPDIVGGFDVGIVPLADVPFNRAKSWIKGLEYAAAGIPFVASATPEYEALAAEGAGLTARTPAQFRDALTRLLDPAERAAAAAAGLAVAARHDLSARIGEWEDVYTRAVAAA